MQKIFRGIRPELLAAFILLLLALAAYRGLPSCGFVAALFLLHPLHVESVAWISERKDVLSTFFWLLTMWCYTGYLSSPGKFRYLMVNFVFMPGLMSRPMLVTLAAGWLVLD